MENLDNLLQNNREWAVAVSANDPEFFKLLANQQKPQYLWIGCSDSRVPALRSPLALSGASRRMQTPRSQSGKEGLNPLLTPAP